MENFSAFWNEPILAVSETLGPRSDTYRNIEIGPLNFVSTSVRILKNTGFPNNKHNIKVKRWTEPIQHMLYERNQNHQWPCPNVPDISSGHSHPITSLYHLPKRPLMGWDNIQTQQEIGYCMGKDRIKQIPAIIENACIAHPRENTHQPAVVFKAKEKRYHNEWKPWKLTKRYGFKIRSYSKSQGEWSPEQLFHQRNNQGGPISRNAITK